MNRCLPLALILASAAPILAQAPAPPARANLWIDVSAAGRNGAPVTDLRPDEFEVWISGYRVPVEDVAFVTPGDVAAHRRAAARQRRGWRRSGAARQGSRACVGQANGGYAIGSR